MSASNQLRPLILTRLTQTVNDLGFVSKSMVFLMAPLTYPNDAKDQRARGHVKTKGQRLKAKNESQLLLVTPLTVPLKLIATGLRPKSTG